MKKILGLLCLSLLSCQLLAQTGPISEEDVIEAEKNIYKTDNTLESIAGIISSRVDSEFGGGVGWIGLNGVTSKIKGYKTGNYIDKDDEMNVLGIGKAYIKFHGANSGIDSIDVKFKRSQGLEKKITDSMVSQFDPASEITSIVTCDDDGSSILSKDVFRLVLPGREPMSFKIHTDDEFIKFEFSPSDSLTCGQAEELQPESTSSEFTIKGDL